jgi:hypothetical protein
LVEDFRANMAPLEGEFDFHLITDGQHDGVTDTRARFYAGLDTAQRPQGFSEADELDVIERCRYLRNLVRPQALRMLRSMASVLAEEMDGSSAQAVLSHMVDDYITHLLAELARRRGLVFAGFAYSYFPDKAQVTQYGYGLALDVREPSDEETREVLEQISGRTFRQNYQQKDTYTRGRHLKAMLRYRVKQVVFGMLRRLKRDPLHMHYAALPFVVERRRWSDFPTASDFHADWRERVTRAHAQAGKPLVYFPLSYFPEATIDYWIPDRRAIAYLDTVLDICRALSQDFTVVVKEHLHMLGARSTGFYRQLRDLPGVISVPPLEYSNDVLANADCVLMGAGSIGVESFIRGKTIVSFCATSYWFEHARSTALPLDDLAAWPQAIRAAIARHVTPTDDERFDFIRQCLRSTLRQARKGRVWPICDPQDMAGMLRLCVRHAESHTACAPAVQASAA